VLPVATVIVVSALAVPVRLTDAGENEHAAPTGSPEQAKVTDPVKPPLGARLTVAEVLWPEVTLKELVDALKEKVPDPEAGATAAMEPNRPSLSWFKPAAK